MSILKRSAKRLALAFADIVRPDPKYRDPGAYLEQAHRPVPENRPKAPPKPPSPEIAPTPAEHS